VSSHCCPGTTAEGRSGIYVPIMQNGKVVDSQGFTFDPEDDDTAIAPPVRAAP
jgi:hypothetical protein